MLELEKHFKAKVIDKEVWRKLIRRLPEQYKVERTILTIKLDAGKMSRAILNLTLSRKFEELRKDMKMLEEEEQSTGIEGAFVGSVGKPIRNVPQEQKTCGLCSKLGHVREDCWEDPKKG